MITIAKAIEILDLNVKEADRKMPPDCKESLQLGIQAMKRLQYLREYPLDPPGILLPGETEESEDEP